MTEKEINEAVALKLGWNLSPSFGWMSPSTKHRKPNDPICQFDPPDYCHSIAAAWEIVDRLKETELFALCFHDGGWHCEINCCDGERPIDEEADTAPMAISLAFLKFETSSTNPRR